MVDFTKHFVCILFSNSDVVKCDKKQYKAINIPYLYSVTLKSFIQLKVLKCKKYTKLQTLLLDSDFENHCINLNY